MALTVTCEIIDGVAVATVANGGGSVVGAEVQFLPNTVFRPTVNGVARWTIPDADDTNLSGRRYSPPAELTVVAKLGEATSAPVAVTVPSAAATPSPAVIDGGLTGVLVVDTHLGYRTIAEALAVAQTTGAAVQVSPGTWAEDLSVPAGVVVYPVVPNSVTIDGDAVIAAGARIHGIVVTGNVTGAGVYTPPESLDVGVLEGRVDTAEGEIDTLQTDVGTAQGDITTAEGNITTLQTDMGTAQGDITGLKDDVKLGGAVVGPGESVKTAHDALAASLDWSVVAGVWTPADDDAQKAAPLPLTVLSGAVWDLTNPCPKVNLIDLSQIGQPINGHKHNSWPVPATPRNSRQLVWNCGQRRIAIRIDDFPPSVTDTTFAELDGATASEHLALNGVPATLAVPSDSSSLNCRPRTVAADRIRLFKAALLHGLAIASHGRYHLNTPADDAEAIDEIVNSREILENLPVTDITQGTNGRGFGVSGPAISPHLLVDCFIQPGVWTGADYNTCPYYMDRASKINSASARAIRETYASSMAYLDCPDTPHFKSARVSFGKANTWIGDALSTTAIDAFIAQAKTPGPPLIAYFHDLATEANMGAAASTTIPITAFKYLVEKLVELRSKGFAELVTLRMALAGIETSPDMGEWDKTNQQYIVPRRGGLDNGYLDGNYTPPWMTLHAGVTIEANPDTISWRPTRPGSDDSNPQSYRLKYAGSGADYYASLQVGKMDLKPGRWYTLSFDAYSDKASSHPAIGAGTCLKLSANAACYLPSGAGVSTNISRQLRVPLTAPGWARCWLPFWLPPGCTNYVIDLKNWSNDGAAATVSRFDNFEAWEI